MTTCADGSTSAASTTGSPAEEGQRLAVGEAGCCGMTPMGPYVAGHLRARSTRANARCPLERAAVCGHGYRDRPAPRIAQARPAGGPQ